MSARAVAVIRPVPISSQVERSFRSCPTASVGRLPGVGIGSVNPTAFEHQVCKDGDPPKTLRRLSRLLRDAAEPDDVIAIHQPDHNAACSLLPQDVGAAVSVEVPNSGYDPTCPDVSKSVEACDSGSIHQPYRHITGYRAPQDVGAAVSVEVPNSGYDPTCPYVSDRV